MSNQNVLSTENKVKLNDAIQILRKIAKNGATALHAYPSDSYTLFHFVLINYLERFTFAIDSIEFLLSEFNKRMSIEGTIGLIIRAGLLDFITISYLITYKPVLTPPSNETVHTEFDEEFNAFLTDQIRNTFKYLRLAATNGLISDSDCKSAINNMHYTYSFLFKDGQFDIEKPEELLLTKRFLSPQIMFKRISSHELTKKHAAAYDYYQLYSKYEHFGIMTHFMQRMAFNEMFSNIISSVKYLTLGLGVVIICLNTDKEKLSKELKLHMEYSTLFNAL